LGATGSLPASAGSGADARQHCWTSRQCHPPRANSFRDGVFEGEIVDNGRGFNQEDTKQEVNNPHGLGLLGMQERVAQCNGTVEITSRPGEGTRIRVFIPLSEGCYE